MKFVFRVKHFDVLIINRTENMTSMDCITQLGNESEVNRKRGDPQLKKEPSPEQKLPSWKAVWKRSFKHLLSFVFLK